MTCSSTRTRGQAAWTVVIVCLTTLGCRAQFSLDDDAPTPPAVSPFTPSAPPTGETASWPTVAPSAVSPATKVAAREMGIAALNSSPNPDAPVRLVPHYSAVRPPIQPAALIGPTVSDQQKADKPTAVEAQKPPAAMPAVVGSAVPVVEAAPRMAPPNEKAKSTLPAYVIEPPDVLIIDGTRLIPRPPYRIETLDVLVIEAPNALPGQPIAGPYTVTPDGTVNLGFGYGSVRVIGMTLEQAAAAIKASLRLNKPQVSVALGQFRGVQQVRGEHLVGQDGTISLGTYGCVNVTGLTLSQAKCEIERHLARWLADPLLSVSIGGYNSKVYYVITDGAGFGQQVFRLPITGNETVLDAISLINGLPPVASKRNIWLARPTPARHGCYEILPIDWEAITEAGSTETNWQLFPGDRVYVKADPFITFDNTLSKVLNPLERMMGFALLGSATVQSFKFTNNGNNLTNGF